jgi:soluble lytic murein transglycosylase-like protein
MPPTRVPSRQLRTLGCTAALAAVAVATAADIAASGGDAAATARAETRAARSQPVAMSDLAAAERVVHSSWEPRPQNRAENRRTPGERTLRRFRRSSQLARAYKRRVTGGYRGTTDEIIQWAAHKWGFSPNLLRAVAAIESRWKMGAVGDDGQSFGIMQVKRGPHCCFPTTRRSTAFNLDYYGAYLRSLYDGRVRWLNTVERGERYRAGDLWGSVGVWYSGRWRYGSGEYIRLVKDIIRQRVWRRSGFRRG